MGNKTREVNTIIAKSMPKVAIILTVLLVTSATGIFNFSLLLQCVIGMGIILVGILPYVFYKMNLSENFLKYYMLFASSVLVCAMGTSNSIGIFISYILVPLISCLYFDRKFTHNVAIFSYITMTIGVFFNTAGKMEIEFLGWSHWECFRNYMIGFTIEYVIVMIFLIQVVRRAQQYMMIQEESLRILRQENEQQKKISSMYRNTISDQKQSAYSILSKDIDNLTPECNARLTAGHRFLVSMQEEMMYVDDPMQGLNRMLALLGEYFDLDRIMMITLLPEDESSKLALQWNRDERNVLKDYYSEMPKKDQEEIIKLYEKSGYIELVGGESYEADNGFTRYMLDVRLGAQVWIPSLTKGNYRGAICYDRVDNRSYSAVEKFLLSEATGIITSHYMRMNSDEANRAKSDFLSSMSHEIRTPMNAIMGMTTIALREDVSPTVRNCLGVIRSSSEGLLSIINDILDISKIESGKIELVPEEYRTLSLLNDVSVMANARNAEKKLEIKYNYRNDLPMSLFGDFVRIKQIMVNLVTNAIKYTDQGTITIDFDCKTDEENQNTILCFSVTDTGQGIKPEDLQKLFRSYSQVNKEKNHHKEGTGLGLMISKQLVEMMEGHIGVESTYGEGSTFHFEIPQKIINASAAGTLENYEYQFDEEEEFKAKNARILIVDDNELNLMIEESLFEPFEMKIRTASSGKEALSLCKENTYDLIFMDHFMPEMDGVETTKRIRAMLSNPNSQIPIIALTADALSGAKEGMLAAGMNDFLSKPLDLKKATQILKKYLPQ